MEKLLRPSLYERMTPEAKQNLEKAQEHYPFTIYRLIGLLKKKSFWQDLQISDVYNLLLYVESESLGVPRQEWKTLVFGHEKLIKPYNDVI